MQPMNLPACDYKTIRVIGTTIGSGDPLAAVLKELPGNSIEIQQFHDTSNPILDGLRLVIRECIAQHSRMLILMPDVVFADGSIFNMRRYAFSKPVSVAFPHLRVNAEHFTKLCYFPIRPGQLVRMAQECAHQSQYDSYTHKDNGTLYGGIALTHVDDTVTTIIHYLPSVFFAWFDQTDLTHFMAASDFGAWDHTWNNHLANTGRFRVFGSSDLAFAAELTDIDRNRIQVVPGTKIEEDSRIGLPWMKCFVGVLNG